MCAIFSALLGLTILAILELAHPYQGSVVVSSQPLQYALSRMDDMDKVAFSGFRPAPPGGQLGPLTAR
jgi:hypothetical protein